MIWLAAYLGVGMITVGSVVYLETIGAVTKVPDKDKGGVMAWALFAWPLVIPVMIGEVMGLRRKKKNDPTQ